MTTSEMLLHSAENLSSREPLATSRSSCGYARKRDAHLFVSLRWRILEILVMFYRAPE